MLILINPFDLTFHLRLSKIVLVILLLAVQFVIEKLSWHDSFLSAVFLSWLKKICKSKYFFQYSEPHGTQ